jgi:DegV family protein with EDD domain
MKTRLVIDSCSDLSQKYYKEHRKHLELIGMPVEIKSIEFLDEFGKNYSNDTFFDDLRNGEFPNTAQINTYRFEKKFEELLEDGENVIYLGFSSGLSGTCQNAFMAKQNIMEKNPNAKIEIVDTKAASIGEGLLVREAVRLIECGASFEEIIEWMNKNKMCAQHWFAVDDLMYLKKGGRISGTKAAVGTMLNVKPILTVDSEGKLGAHSNVRGRKKSIMFLAQKAGEQWILNDSSEIIVGHGQCLEEAEKLKAHIEKLCPDANIWITELSATIASHVGPNMLAVAFFGERR